MRSNKSFIFWSIWNYAVMIFDAWIAGESIARHEYVWAAAFFALALLMVWAQSVNRQLRERGKQAGIPSRMVPVVEYTTEPSDMLKDLLALKNAVWAEAFTINLLGDTTIEEALDDLGYQLRGEPGLAAPGEAMLAPDNRTVIVRSEDAGEMGPEYERVMNELYSLPINHGRSFQKLDRGTPPMGV